MYRVIFWRPRPGTQVWSPPEFPLGETIRKDVLSGLDSVYLEPIEGSKMLERLKTVFANSHVDNEGNLHWSDESDNGFIAGYGAKFVEVVSFDMDDDDLDKVFGVAEEFDCDLYDWGN